MMDTLKLDKDDAIKHHTLLNRHSEQHEDLEEPIEDFQLDSHKKSSKKSTAADL